jgi:DNA-binding response OmpR family regulator
VHAAALEGERILLLEDEPLIAFDVREVLESEGATVLVAPTISEALQCACHPTLSAGVLDVVVHGDHAEPVCEALSRRGVPFVFFTGMSSRPLIRWPGAPIVQKPAASAAIVGALKFALSADTSDIVVEPESAQEDASVARIDKLIFDGEQRVLRMRLAIARLEAKGFDSSAGEAVLATMTKIVENMRVHRRMIASSAWRRPLR